MFGALAVYIGDLSSYRESIGGGLRTGEACSTADIILNIGHGLQQTCKLLVIGNCSQYATWIVQISVLLSQFLSVKNLPYSNGTAHSIVQLNWKRVYGSEVAFYVW